MFEHHDQRQHDDHGHTHSSCAGTTFALVEWKSADMLSAIVLGFMDGKVTYKSSVGF